MDDKLEKYCKRIVMCLVHYGGLEETEAWQLLNESKICEVRSEMDRDMLFHELAYYWAMMLLYAERNPKWYLDSALWPPPEEYYDLE